MRHLLILFVALVAATCVDAENVSQRPLLKRDREIALAESAGPAEVARHAAIYVLGKTGYVKARDGENGFTCLVVRDTPLDIAPVCHDPEGTRTVVPRLLAEAKLRAEGKTEDEILRAIHEGIASGDYAFPRRVGIAYMLSTENAGLVDGRMIHPLPHVMLYAPFVRMSDIGARPSDLFHPDLPAVLSEGQFNAYVIIHVPATDLPAESTVASSPGDSSAVDYLFPSRDAEISAARGAAPAYISSQASVYVLTSSGVVKGIEGNNGFACFVERDYDPRVRMPVCYDPEGARSALPMVLRKAELLQHRKSIGDIEAELADGFRTGQYRPPTRISVAYSLSPDGYSVSSDKRVVRSAPHIRVYAPYVKAKDVGGLTAATEAEAVARIPTVIHEGTPDAFIIVNLKTDGGVSHH